MPAAIEFRDLEVRTPQGRVLLDHISLALEQGGVTAILGRSGSGKTTLLRTVNRMVEATGGAVLVNGRDVREANLISLRRRMGYVIQETGLFPHFTVERNVGLVLEAEGREREGRAQRSRELLAAVGLDAETFARRLPHQLSGGQRQRVGLARALAAEPPILLMDEPFGALDPITRAEIQMEFKKLQQKLGKTIVFVTHDVGEALLLGDRIGLMEEGRLRGVYTSDEFLRAPDESAKAYVDVFRVGQQMFRD